MEGKCCGKYWDEKLGYVLFKDGEFCGFSTNYDKDYQTGGSLGQYSLGQYPVALVKLPSGKMVIPRVEHIQFTDTAPIPAPPKEEDIAPKDFLKSGMIVETRSGSLYLVMLNTDMKNTPVSSTGVLRGIGTSGRLNGHGWMDLNTYKSDLTNRDNEEDEDDSFDIDAIYTTSFAADIGMFDHYRKVWDRENGYH